MESNPFELAKQLQNQNSKKRRGLKSSEEIIEFYKNENLELKMKVRNLEDDLKKVNYDETQQDLFAQLVARNEQLEKELEEREKSEERIKGRKDADSQTNLDLLNMEELLKASILLKKQKQTKQIKEPVSIRQLGEDEKSLLEILYRIDGNMTTALDKLRAKLDIHPQV